MIGAIIGSAALGVAAMVGIAGYYAVTDEDDDEDNDEGDRAAVARALRFAKVTLQQGLTASELEGHPISAKFEVDRGKFQLSVYTWKDGRFSEVLVDYSTGDIMKAQPITQGNDLDVAQAQHEAMTKAKIGLREAVDRTLVDAAGFRAVAVVPNLKDGRAVASVLLFKGEDSKIVNQTLD